MLLIFRQYLFAALFFAAGVALSVGVFGFDLMFHPEWAEFAAATSRSCWCLPVTLLGIEWLTRKLLKLA